MKILLEELSKLKFLEDLNIAGNPVLTNNFNPKSKILSTLRNLRKFNGQDITKDDIWNATVKLEKIDELWKTLIEEKINLKAYKEVLKKIKIHEGIQKIHPTSSKKLHPIPTMLEQARRKIFMEFDPLLYRQNKEQKILELYFGVAC